MDVRAHAPMALLRNGKVPILHTNGQGLCQGFIVLHVYKYLLRCGANASLNLLVLIRFTTENGANTTSSDWGF